MTAFNPSTQTVQRGGRPHGAVQPQERAHGGLLRRDGPCMCCTRACIAYHNCLCRRLNPPRSTPLSQPPSTHIHTTIGQLRLEEGARGGGPVAGLVGQRGGPGGDYWGGGPGAEAAVREHVCTYGGMDARSSFGLVWAMWCICAHLLLYVRSCVETGVCALIIWSAAPNVRVWKQMGHVCFTCHPFVRDTQPVTHPHTISHHITQGGGRGGGGGAGGGGGHGGDHGPHPADPAAGGDGAEGTKKWMCLRGEGCVLVDWLVGAVAR